MSKATEYRQLAAKFRQHAHLSSLPQRRQLALAAAERWEALADEAEITAGPTAALCGAQPSWTF